MLFLYAIISSAVNLSCTSQRPFQEIIFTSVWAAIFFARYSSGRNITLSTPRDSTTCFAFPDVQHTSVSAFTSADVFTYVTTGTPGYFCFNNLISSAVMTQIKNILHEYLELKHFCLG